MQKKEEGIDINWSEVFQLMLKRIWLFALVAVILGGGGYLFSKLTVTPQYQSTTRIYIYNPTKSGTYTYNDALLASQLTKDCEQVIKCRSVLEPIISDLDLRMSYESLQRLVSVVAAEDTRVITITITYPDARMAQRIADAVREASAQRILAVMGVEAVNTIDAANLPMNPTSASAVRVALIAALVGILLVAVMILIFYLRDDTIKSEEDVTKYLNVSTLASVPVWQTQQETGRKSGTGKKNGKRG